MKVFRQPYLVDRLVLNELSRETPSLAVIYKNEFDMAIAAFILQSADFKKLKVQQKQTVRSDLFPRSIIANGVIVWIFIDHS